MFVHKWYPVMQVLAASSNGQFMHPKMMKFDYTYPKDEAASA